MLKKNSRISPKEMNSRFYHLALVVQNLSLARTTDEVVNITRHAARELTGADGATFVLREGKFCHYVDEDAIGPLWRGKRFPIKSCISGLAILNKKVVAIEDIYQDDRVPIDAYSRTFVKSMVVVPIRTKKPLGAIGNYWAKKHLATAEEIHILTALANSSSIALQNIKLVSDLKKANNSLSHSLHARDEFLSIASHELKTPLSALKLQLQLTQKRNSANHSLVKTFEMSLKQVDNLTHLVNEILEVSRLRLDRITLAKNKTNLSLLIVQIADFFRPQFIISNNILQLEIEPNIIGEWDEIRIKQVFNYLFSNILKYAPNSPVHIKVSMISGNRVSISLKDGGPGIPKLLQKRIFERFERAVSSRNISGLGLGLFIAKKLVEAHKGILLLNSEEGYGSEFIIELPLLG